MTILTYMPTQIVNPLSIKHRKT